MSQANVTDIIAEAVKQAFHVQTQVNVSSIKVGARGKYQTYPFDIASVLGLSSEKVGGSLSICFPQATFLGVYEKMLGEKHTTISSEIADAAGEILNIVYGVAKTQLNQNGHSFTPSIPTVVRGSAMELNQLAGGVLVQIVCESDVGPFFLELNLRRNAGG